MVGATVVDVFAKIFHFSMPRVSLCKVTLVKEGGKFKVKTDEIPRIDKKIRKLLLSFMLSTFLNRSKEKTFVK